MTFTTHVQQMMEVFQWKALEAAESTGLGPLLVPQGEVAAQSRSGDRRFFCLCGSQQAAEEEMYSGYNYFHPFR